mgnify:CR=1 FL=1
MIVIGSDHGGFALKEEIKKCEKVCSCIMFCLYFGSNYVNSKCLYLQPPIEQTCNHPEKYNNKH